MNDEQFKELIRALNGISWQLKRLADERSPELTDNESLYDKLKRTGRLPASNNEVSKTANPANIEKLKSLMKRKD